MEIKNPLILLTNDDGFTAPGITTLYEHLLELGETYIVAPDRERSAASLALSLHNPLRVKPIRPQVFAVDGTPADCVYLAIQKLLPRKPDIIISGINPGPNLGQQDISYSGTVAAAIQGTFFLIPSLAVSLIPDTNGRCAFDFTAKIARRVAGRMLHNEGFPGITINLNVPPPPFRGIKIAPLGQKHYQPEIIVRKDPRNRDYYWIGTGQPKAVGPPESDVMVIKAGYTTATPLQRDFTAYKAAANPSFADLFSDIPVTAD